MNATTSRFALCILFATATPACQANTYLGIVPPETPQPFEPPLLAGSTVRSLTCVSFMPDMRRVALSSMDAGPDGKVATTIYESRLIRDEWSVPTLIPAFGAMSGGEAAFSPDGRWLYFSSDRTPAKASRPRAFRAPVSHDSIGTPEMVMLAIAPEASVYYPRPLPDGDLLFTSRGPVGGDDLFIAPAQGGGYGEPEPLGGDFNSAKDDWDLVESADARLRIWVSAREGGLGRTDLWFSRRGTDGPWSPARNLTVANTPALETAPSLTPDGRALFFLRRVNGKDRMFWVRLAAVLEM